MGNLLSCPNCFTREFQSTADDGPNVSDTCMLYHTSFTGPQATEDCTENPTEGPQEELSKSEIIDSLQKVLKGFLNDVKEEPESIGYTKALTSGNIEIYLKDVIGGYSLMSVWKCDIPSQKIAKFLRMVEKRKEWDTHVAECKKICDVSEEIAVYYTLYKRFLTMAQRDVLLISRQFRMEDAWIDISTSIKSDIVPQNDKVVRANIGMSGYYIQDIPKDESGNCSLVVSIFEANYGQSVAGAIVKKMTVSIAPKYVKAMIDAMKKVEEEIN